MGPGGGSGDEEQPEGGQGGEGEDDDLEGPLGKAVHRRAAQKEAGESEQ